MTGKPGRGNSTARRGSPPPRRVIISMNPTRSIREVARGRELGDIVEAVMADWLEHERMMTALEQYMSEHGVGSFGYLQGGPTIVDIMAEFDLTEQEARDALQELGERLRQK